MPGKDIIRMSVKELQRVSIINKVADKELTQVKAAEVLGLSTRQVRRLSKRVIAEGERGLIHRSRGKPSGRGLSESVKKRALELYQLLHKTTAKRVMVEERTDGSMLIKHNGNSLRFKEIQSRPTKPKPAKPEMLMPRKQDIPSNGHPWRNFNYQKPDISVCVKSGHF